MGRKYPLTHVFNFSCLSWLKGFLCALLTLRLVPRLRDVSVVNGCPKWGRRMSRMGKPALREFKVESEPALRVPRLRDWKLENKGIKHYVQQSSNPSEWVSKMKKKYSLCLRVLVREMALTVLHKGVQNVCKTENGCVQWHSKVSEWGRLWIVLL